MLEKSLSKYLFLIVSNKRLEFDNSLPDVSEFVSSRLKFHGAESMEFVESRQCLDQKINSLIGMGDSSYDYIAVIDLMNPITDIELLLDMAATLDRTGAKNCISDGAIPGTEIDKVISLKPFSESQKVKVNGLGKDVVTVRWNTQTKYNNQFNLYKYKRLKLFLILKSLVDNLCEQSIDEFISTLSQESVFTRLAGFGENLNLETIENCLHCESRLRPLTSVMSQPFCGYLPVSRPMYHECETCGLVLQSPVLQEQDLHKIYDKWDKEDFVVSTNNPYTDDSVRCDLAKIIPLLGSEVSTLDLGGGMGNYSKYLSNKYLSWNVTHSDFEIKAQVDGDINSRTLDFTKDKIGDEQYDIITAWEVIEHVPFHKLSDVISNIWQALKPGGFFIFSTPDFDSPLCKSFDFYAACPPFHYTVFGEKWLKEYFSSSDFKVFDIRHCSDFLDDAANWYSYGEKTCPSMALRSTSSVLRRIFELDFDNSIKNQLVAEGLGTEIVMTLRKGVIE